MKGGTFRGEIFTKENENNYIVSEIYIKNEDINEDIRIINSYEEFERPHKGKLKMNIRMKKK